MVVGRSRFKTFLILLGAIAFLLIGIWLLFLDNSDIYRKIIGGLTMLFSGAAIPIGIKKLVRNEAALAFNEEYLIIEPASKNKLALPWTEIEAFEVVQIKGTKIIIIKVKDPLEWIQKESNPVKKKLMQFNNNMYKSPFNIASSGLNISHEKLFDLLNEKLVIQESI